MSGTGGESKPVAERCTADTYRGKKNDWRSFSVFPAPCPLCCACSRDSVGGKSIDSISRFLSLLPTTIVDSPSSLNRTTATDSQDHNATFAAPPTSLLSSAASELPRQNRVLPTGPTHASCNQPRTTSSASPSGVHNTSLNPPSSPSQPSSITSFISCATTSNL